MNHDSLSKALADAVLPSIAPMVQAALDAALAARPADIREVHVTMPERPTINVGRQHAQFPALVRTVAAGVPVWLVGPAGSGKTVGAEHVSSALEMQFSAVSVGPHTTQAHLMGYMDATGTYRGTEVRTRFEQGGLLLLDEIDRGNPGVLTCLNALLANAVCAFPDGMIKRHERFRVVAAANTIGSGADRQYVGAMQLDAATLDRFAMLDWAYDEAFELELAAQRGGESGREWAVYVQALRASVSELKVRHVVSPRATLGGIALQQAGASWAEAAEMVLWRGLDTNTRMRVLEHTSAKAPSTEPALDPTPNAEPVQGGVHAARVSCPNCHQVVTTYHSRLTPGQVFCWKRHGGCGANWMANATH